MSRARDIANILGASSPIIDGAPSALDTLNELAAALGDDSNYAATITTSLSNITASISNKQKLIPMQSASPSAFISDLWVDSTISASPILKIYSASGWITVAGGGGSGGSIVSDDDQIILSTRIFG